MPALADSGLLVAVIVAASLTSLVALGMMLRALHRRARLTGGRGAAAGSLALGVIAVAVGGVLSVAPAAAQPAPDDSSYVVLTDEVDIQLPTLAE